MALPGPVPIAELVPELARRLGVVNPATTHHRCVTRTVDGRVLRADLGVSAQGVEHGDILLITAVAADHQIPRYDDPAEAMAQVASEVPPWNPRAACWAHLVAAASLLVVGAGCASTRRGDPWAFWSSLLVAGALVLAAAAFSRLRGETALAIVLAYVGCGYAAVAGMLFVGQGPLGAAAVVDAGASVAVTGLLTSAVLVGDGCLAMLPAVVTGTVVAAVAGLSEVARVESAPMLSGLLVLVVLGWDGLPWLCLSTAGAGRHVLIPADQPSLDTAVSIDLERVSAHARRARRLLTVGSATSGALLVLLAPFAVSLGPPGPAVPLLGAAVVMLRVRRSRAAVDVGVGLASGVLTVSFTLVSWAWRAADWRPIIGTGAAALGLVVLVEVLGSSGAGMRRTWLGDLVERAALGALVPSLLLGLVLTGGGS